MYECMHTNRRAYMQYCHVGMNDACMYGRMHSRVAYVYVCTIARMHVYTHASVMYV